MDDKLIGVFLNSIGKTWKNVIKTEKNNKYYVKIYFKNSSIVENFDIKEKNDWLYISYKHSGWLSLGILNEYDLDMYDNCLPNFEFPPTEKNKFYYEWKEVESLTSIIYRKKL